MATFTTTNYDAQAENRANPSRLASANVASGEVEFAVVEYTLAGTEATGDVINVCLLPAGAIPLPHLSGVLVKTDPGTALTIDLGTADNLDGLADGIDCKAVGHVAAMSGTMPAWVTPTPIVADTNSGNAIVKATLASVDTPTADAVIYFVIAFKRGR